MEPLRLRERLMKELDRVVEIVAASSVPEGAYLRIEASLVDNFEGRRSESVPRRLFLDTIKLPSSSIGARGNRVVTTTGTDSANERSEVQHLPSPAQSASHSPILGHLADSNVLDPENDDNAMSQQSFLSDALRSSRQKHAHRRKTVGGLSIRRISSTAQAALREPSPPSTRQLQTTQTQVRKRRRLEETPKMQQSNVDKLIEGIWKEIHNPATLVLDQNYAELLSDLVKRDIAPEATRLAPANLEVATQTCRRITDGARSGRALEVIMQAHWVDCFDAQIVDLAETKPQLRPAEHKKMTFMQACKSFSWSEKDLRNRMAIWKGYRDIKNAAGWSALIFAGPGIYRFCKYRLGLDPEALSKLRVLKTRFEIAADTLHAQWRQLLPIVGESAQLHWRGHPHDWVVSKRKDALPLAFTYRQWDTNFSFEHIQESIIDTEKWGEHVDPRRTGDGPDFFCTMCSLRQSQKAEDNECVCFAELFGLNNTTKPCPVQVFQTENGRNNGLIACCSFPRGNAVGEFVGLITKGLSHIDVMQSRASEDGEPYQIWQGRCGNFTRFINHSCEPNCQFQTFSWLGVQRILVVSKGVPAGKELTVDYSSRYWQQLDKKCLCGSVKCRFSNRLPPSSG